MAGWRRLVVLVAVAVVVAADVDKYDEGRFAHIDVDEVLANQRILTSFVKCFLDQGPCTADAREMKRLLPEVIDSLCAKCTDNQKKLMAKAVLHVKNNRPSEWQQLSDKYDPDHSKQAQLHQFLSDAVSL
nr:chemosensory protein [Odontothrips loti]